MNDKDHNQLLRKKILIAIFVVIVITLLIVGAITIPPHFKAAAKATKPIKPETTQLPSLVLDKENANVPVIPPDTDTDTKTTPIKNQDINQDPANYTTSDRPSLADFLWYTEDDFYDGIPTEAMPISSIESLTGSWKALIVYDPDNVINANGMRFLNLDISKDLEKVTLKLDWYLAFWSEDGETYDETDIEDDSFIGKWETTGLWASGAGTIHITNFYTQNNMQYAIGTVDEPDGTPAYIALVRP